MFKTVPLDFIGFQGCQNAKIVDNKIVPSELIAHCPPSFRRHKAASRDGRLMADTSYSQIQIKYSVTSRRI